MDVLVDVSHELAPDIEPPIILSTVSLEVIDDFEKPKSRIPH